MKEENKILFADLNYITDHASRAYIKINLKSKEKVSNTNIMDYNIEHHNIKKIKLKENKFKMKIKCHQTIKKIIPSVIIILMELIIIFRIIRLLC
ncbi:unnamed protein product [Brassica rapa subsp. trilocularis]